jgi:class 3 adenylate cyclase/predicted ATPase
MRGFHQPSNTSPATVETAQLSPRFTGADGAQRRGRVTSCVGCAAEVPPQAKFCQECGTRVAARSCPRCGATAERGQFCNDCGAAIDGTSGTPDEVRAPVPPVVELRVTSVLFADLVGFTPLSESRDPEEVRELLSRYFTECRTVIGRYGGTVEKFIGDAVMAVWGVPSAHEDDAERAVRAGLELVQAIAGVGDDAGAPGLAMRVGVVTGEVAVTVGATAEGMVAGDAVNTASRVQSVARPGQVWVDETTRELTSAAITYDDAGEHALKGKATPARLWRAGAVVAEVGGGQRVDGLEAPLTGRFRELRLLKELFHATEESLRPRLVVLDAGPGMGKSRLAWEFEKYIDGLSSTAWWHRGRCLSYGEGVAFWALAEAIRGRLGLVETESGQVAAEHLEQALAELVHDAEERDWLRPRVASLIGAGPAGGFAREDLFAAWATFFERVGAGLQPIVLVLDDAQYADDGLLDFLDHLLATSRAGVFVLALARPELLARRPDLGGRRMTVVRLDPLDDAAMATLVDGLIVGLPAATRATLVARAEGVPLFAVETVRALIDRDAVVPRDGQYVPTEGIDLDLEKIGAPASLQALVAARLDALSHEERRLVADASVLGMSFTRDGIAAVSSEAVDLDASLASLQRKEILSVQQDRLSAERGQYRFVQSVVRQVAYATQSKHDRRARHLTAADHLSAQPDPADDLAVVIAQHLLDAVDASATNATDVPQLTAQARELLERAARRAWSLGSPAEAQRLFEAALSRAEDPTDQARLQLAAAESALDAGNYQAAIERARAATTSFDARGLPVEAGAAAAAHALSLIWLEDNGGAIAIAEPRWQALAGAPGAERARLRLAEALTNAHSFRGDNDATARYAEQMIMLAEAVKDSDALAQAHIRRGSYYQAAGAPITALAMYESARAIARGQGLPERQSMALINLTTVQISRDLGAAVEFGHEALDVSRRWGGKRLIEYAAINYLLALWVSGRLAEVEAVLVTERETVVEPGNRMILSTIESWLAEARGRPMSTSPLTAASDNVNALAWLANLDLTQALANGDNATAARIAEQSITHLLAASGIEDDFMHLWPPLVQGALAAGDTTLAERLLEPVSSAPPGIVSPAVAAQYQRLSGLVGAVRGDAPEQIETHLRAGISALDAFGAVGLRAQSEEELGRWLAEQGRDEDAAAMLGNARRTYADIGATGWLARLDAWRVSCRPA